jgi:hypothetical protein
MVCFHIFYLLFSYGLFSHMLPFIIIWSVITYFTFYYYMICFYIFYLLLLYVFFHIFYLLLLYGLFSHILPFIIIWFVFTYFTFYYHMVCFHIFYLLLLYGLFSYISGDKYNGVPIYVLANSTVLKKNIQLKT